MVRSVVERWSRRARGSWWVCVAVLLAACWAAAACAHSADAASDTVAIGDTARVEAAVPAASSVLVRAPGAWSNSFVDSAEKARVLRRERRAQEVGDAGDAVGLLGCTGLFVFMAHDEEKWVAGSNLALATMIGLFAPSETDTSEFPVLSRLALVGGMGALSAYELRHGAGMSDARLFWINTGGILLTVLVTNFLYVRG